MTQMARSSRLALVVAAIAVAFAAADTYVVVLALPDMMGSVGVPVDQLQRAAPIVSGFLLGYVAMLPMIGRIADLRGRVPVLLASLVIFTVGCAVTALAYDMSSMVVGRFVQGVGAGGLVPATMALVADLYPVHRRGVPLGLVSAVQEIGSVLGPVLGAVVLAVADWRAIFALNVAVGALLWAAMALSARGTPAMPEPLPERSSQQPLRWWRAFDWLGALLGLAVLAAFALVLIRPAVVMRDLTWGAIFVPLVDGGGRWTTPAGLLCAALAVAFIARLWLARRPLVDLHTWVNAARGADLPGALLLAAVLGGIVLAFSTADPKVETFSPQGQWYLLGSAMALVAFVVHLRRSPAPLFSPDTFAARPAWGALLVSFFAGAGLIAALVDVPLFARTTIHTDSQVGAAFELVKLLVALPVGAVAGGLLTRRFGAAPVAAGGLALAAGAFALMAQWDASSLNSCHSWVTLAACGLGFGLSLAPVSAALLAFTPDSSHGVASAMGVVTRMIGMLVGVSALTALGLRSYYSAVDAVPSVTQLCGGPRQCPAFTSALREAAITQETTVFAGAAAVCLLGAVVAAVVLATATRSRVGDTARLGFSHG